MSGKQLAIQVLATAAAMVACIYIVAFFLYTADYLINH
jgi:hypothetical protein